MVLAILLFCLIQRTACIWVTNYAHINRRIMFIFKSPNTGAWKLCFVNDLLTSVFSQLNALLLCRSLHRTDAERGDTSPRESDLVFCSTGDIFQLNHSYVFSKKSLGLSLCTCYGEKKAAKRVWKLLNIVLKSRSCVSWWQRAVDIVAAHHK